MPAEASLLPRRILSGMRPTGSLHLGHYFLLQKWVAMQEQHDCFFFIADYHALTSSEIRSRDINQHMVDMVVCWLVAGIDPDRSVLFVQSQVREHAELHLILSMICPLPWLQRIPHYKDVADSLSDDKINYGFLGYPVLQAADILAHGASYVPVGEDQEAHVEIAARLARSFNDRFGKDDNWEAKAQNAIQKLPKPDQFMALCRQANQDGNAQARESALKMAQQAKLDSEDAQRLQGWVEGRGRQILVQPQPVISDIPRLHGLDGTKMSKSLQNDIGMLEDKSSMSAKIKVMPTDPARVRRSDPGQPEKCLVWDYHLLFTEAEERKEIYAGCTQASIGCLDCKAKLVEKLANTLAPLQEKARPLLAKRSEVIEIIANGNERAQASAADTMAAVRSAVGLTQV